MQISDFSLLTDENIQSDVVNFLRNEDFNVKDVKEEGLEGSSTVSSTYIFRILFSRMARMVSRIWLT